MIVRLDHVGVVAHSLDEARDVLVDKLGLPLDEQRSRGLNGSYFAPERTLNFFVQVGEGETQIEILIPQDTTSGVAKFLHKRGPGLHHLGYAVDDVPADARLLRERGLEQIDLGGQATAAFFYPRSAMGILTELVPVRTLARLHTAAQGTR
ncbi:MAG TPA: VOC family protein [Dehalococcoidia bacterium]|nr:VOC family protein [Dehalococcoidia bacterium]